MTCDEERAIAREENAIAQQQVTETRYHVIRRAIRVRMRNIKNTTNDEVSGHLIENQGIQSLTQKIRLILSAHVRGGAVSDAVFLLLLPSSNDQVDSVGNPFLLRKLPPVGRSILLIRIRLGVRRRRRQQQRQPRCFRSVRNATTRVYLRPCLSALLSRSAGRHDRYHFLTSFRSDDDIFASEKQHLGKSSIGA